MNKLNPTKREITISPAIVKEVLLKALMDGGYLPIICDPSLLEIHPYRCGTSKDNAIGVKIILK